MAESSQVDKARQVLTINALKVGGVGDVEPMLKPLLQVGVFSQFQRNLLLNNLSHRGG